MGLLDKDHRRKVRETHGVLIREILADGGMGPIQHDPDAVFPQMDFGIEEFGGSAIYLADDGFTLCIASTRCSLQPQVVR